MLSHRSRDFPTKLLPLSFHTAWKVLNTSWNDIEGTTRQHRTHSKGYPDSAVWQHRKTILHRMYALA